MGKYAIFLVLALTFSLLTYSYALRNSVFLSNQRNIDSFSYNQAHNIAQSAAMVAINNIRNGDDSNFRPGIGSSYSFPQGGGYSTWDDMNGKYRLEIVNQGDTLYHISSTGLFDENSYEVTVGLNTQGFQDWNPAEIDKAIHAESELDMGNSEVDYGDVSLNRAFNLVSINPQASIAGNLFVFDPDEAPGVMQNGNENSGSGNSGQGGGNSGQGNSGGGGQNNGVEGDIINLDDRLDYPEPFFPNFPTGNTYMNENSSSQNLGPINYENYLFETFTANNLTLDVGGQNRELHVRNLDLSGDFEIEGDGNIEIFVEESINLGNGNINTNGLPDNLTIYYKGEQDISYTGNGSFTGNLFANHENTSINIGGTPTFTGNILSYGKNVTLHGTPTAASLIYAPNAEVKFKGSAGSFEGAIVSDRFDGSGQPVITYNPEFESTLPELLQESDEEYSIAFWN